MGSSSVSQSDPWPWPSAVNVANFVTVKPYLKGDENENSDFEIWKEQMMCLLESQDVACFVNGEVLPPANTTSDHAWRWRRTDRLVKGWILGSVGKDALDAVWDKGTARDVWLELHHIFNHQRQLQNVNVEDFVRVRPCLEGDERSNFEIWKKEMLRLLKDQDLLGLVVPPKINGNKQKLWRSADGLVKRWILGSIGEDARDAVSEKLTARDVWVELENIFRRKEAAEAKPVISRGAYSRYLPVYHAALRGDWETATNFFPDEKDLGTTIISSFSETALHIAVLSGKANDFVKRLVRSMPSEVVAVTDWVGDTALHNAAGIGNTEAVRVLVNKYPTWLRISNKDNNLPVMKAVTRCKKHTLKFLISKHEEYPELNIFEGQLGIQLLIRIINSEFLDVALDLAKKHPNLATLTDEGNDSALSVLAAMDTLFPRLETFGWWQTFIFHLIPVKRSKSEAASVEADIENVREDGVVQENFLQIIFGGKVGQKMKFMFWTAIERLVPKVKKLRKKKAMHQQALQLVDYLCDQLLDSPEPENEPFAIFEKAILRAAEYGITEIVEMIIDKYPEIIYLRGSNSMNVFQLAAKYRFENIINLIYNMSDRKYIIYDCSDTKRNNMMHLCGKLAPPDRLSLVPGSALQMQRELQWFKEMEKYVHPSRRTWPNNEGQTPQMIFTMEHKNLKAEGEKWMKDTANACTIAAALIATVTFAAAFTVPGGLKSDTGIPLFSTHTAFNFFAVSDAISLFTSIFALLMFLSILTSRYAEADFLYVLPTRLSIGLLSLFISITFMMIAFCATFYLVLSGVGVWYLLPIVAGFPIASFVLLQFPLLVDVIWSTYGPGIFGKKTRRFIY